MNRRDFIRTSAFASLAAALGGCRSWTGGGLAVGGAGDANDWPSIFRAAAAAGTEWAIVECETRRDTYADVTASAAFLAGSGV